MWLKIIGGVLVVAATSWMGWETAQRFKNRPRQLREMQSGLKMLETEISYGLTPLPAALAKVSHNLQGVTGDFFLYVHKQMTDYPGTTIRQAWNKGMEYLAENGALTKEDQGILSNFGTTLGVSDREHQIKHLRLVMTQMAAVEADAWDEKTKNERMFRYLGVLSGLAIVILLC